MRFLGLLESLGAFEGGGPLRVLPDISTFLINSPYPGKYISVSHNRHPHSSKKELFAG